nr:DnaJ homolog subfamily C member 2-like [Ipomoea batatas]
MANQRATWTWDEERMFQIALSTYVEGTRNRWKKIAELIPGKSAKDVEEYYPILKANIEAMESSFTQLQTNTNNAPSSSQRREENEEVGSVWDLDELVSCSQVLRKLIPLIVYSINARSHRHHVPKLLEIDHPVAIAIDAADHIPAIGDGAIVAEAVQHVLELVGGDGAVFIDVEDGEGVLEIAQNLLGVDALRVELDELPEIDEAVAVAVDLADHRLQLLLRRHVAQAAHDGPQLRPRDLAIAVDVEFVEHLLQLILQPRPRVKRRRSRDYGSAINLARALPRLLLAEEGYESHIIKYFRFFCSFG